MKVKNVVYIIGFIFISIFSFSCSSTPERAMKITTISTTAINRYENANNELIAGRYDLAFMHYNQAYNLAVSIDDADLLCRIALSSISLKIDTNSLDAIQKNEKSDFINVNSVETILDNAKYFASKTNRCEFLLAICDIYFVKINLARKLKNYKNCESILLNVLKTVKKDDYYCAITNRVLGDISIQLKKYSDAEMYYRTAAKIHTKNRYLSEIGIDWYGVARSLSLSNKKYEAIDAMKIALKYDRDAENTSAIAFDYFACAKIFAKAKATIDDKKNAKENAKWAISIFNSINQTENVVACEEFLKTLD